MALNKKLSRLTGVSIAFGLLAASGAAMAEKTAPRSFVASPDVYTMVAQGPRSKVILATWQPGQRDAWHSHSEMGVYYLTPCSLRLRFPGGGSQEFYGIPEGYAVVHSPVESHQAENIGSNVCKMVMFERW